MKNYQEYLREDTGIREWLMKKLKTSHVSDINIERSPNVMNIIIRTARPGILIGRGGEGSQKLCFCFFRFGRFLFLFFLHPAAVA